MTGLEGMEQEIVRLAEIVRKELEGRPGWAFSLLLYQDRPDPQNGHVLHIARDRDRALPAVAKWVMERLDAEKTKGRA